MSSGRGRGQKMATSTEEPTSPLVEKIVLSLRPVGNTPALKNKKFAVEKTRDIAWLSQWLKTKLKCADNEAIFIYVQQTFAPSPDTELDTLHLCYGTQDKLTLYYCKTPAWG